jgi:hypothetical protein
MNRLRYDLPSKLDPYAAHTEWASCSVCIPNTKTRPGTSFAARNPSIRSFMSLLGVSFSNVASTPAKTSCPNVFALSLAASSVGLSDSLKTPTSASVAPAVMARLAARVAAPFKTILAMLPIFPLAFSHCRFGLEADLGNEANAASRVAAIAVSGSSARSSVHASTNATGWLIAKCLANLRRKKLFPSP